MTRLFRYLAMAFQVFVRFIAILCALVTLFLFSGSLVRQYAAVKTSVNFKCNESLFENIINSPSIAVGICPNTIKHYDVSEEMAEIGIEDIYRRGKNIYFEQLQLVQMHSQGIVYVQQVDSIPHWIRLTYISGQWYYYRVAN